MVPNDSIPFDVVLPRSDPNYLLFDGKQVTPVGRAFPGGAPQWEEPAIQSRYMSEILLSKSADQHAREERTSRSEFQAAVNLIDWFALNEPQANPWRIHNALGRVHPTLVSESPLA